MSDAILGRRFTRWNRADASDIDGNSRQGGLREKANGAALAPLLHPALFFVASIPLLIAAFVLAILSLVRGKVTGGVALLAGVVFAFAGSCASLIDRGKFLPRANLSQNATPRPDYSDLIARKRVKIGMTTEECSQAWGEPERKNKTKTARGLSEQWVYPSGSYLYFVDGELESISTSN